MPSGSNSGDLGELEYYLSDPRPIQLVVRRKPRQVVFLRRKPITAYTPTEAQMRARAAFGQAARSARGLKMVPGMLPPAAQLVRKSLAGRGFGARPREPGWLKVLEAWVSQGRPPAQKVVAGRSETQSL